MIDSIIDAALVQWDECRRRYRIWGDVPVELLVWSSGLCIGLVIETFQARQEHFGLVPVGQFLQPLHVHIEGRRLRQPT